MRQNVTVFQKSFFHCRFTVVVQINGENYGTGTGKNKKEAKAIAAKVTWEMIERQVRKLQDFFSFLTKFGVESLKVDSKIPLFSLI